MPSSLLLLTTTRREKKHRREHVDQSSAQAFSFPQTKPLLNKEPNFGLDAFEMRAIPPCAIFVLNLLQVVCSSASLKIDNALAERPRLECLSDSIVVHIRTKQPFFGRVFVKGQSHLPECSVRGGSNGHSENASNQRSLHVLFENCFLRRQRVFSPHRGVIVTAIVG